MGSQFSAFAGGGLRFTSRKPPAESIYETLREGWGSLFSDDPDAAVNVETFAQAKTLGLASETLQRAGNEANPLYCTELLPKLEIDWRTNPAPNATIHERRGLLVAAMAPKGGDNIAALTAGLRGIVGNDLLAIVPQPLPSWGAGGVYPAPSDLTLVDGQPGKFAPSGDKYAVVQIQNNPIFKPFQDVTYGYIAGETTPIAAGDRIVINPGAIGQSETVMVLSADIPADYPAAPAVFYANFTKTHEIGDYCTTAARPFWVSYRRFLHVVVGTRVLLSPSLRQRCNEFLAKAVGHGVQWALVAASGSGTAGPFTIGLSTIGETPIGTVTWTPDVPVVYPSFYMGVGAAYATTVAGLTEFTGRTSLGFETTLSPSNQKVYVAFPASLGPARFSVDSFFELDQTEGFGLSIIWISGVQYRLYESTDLLTATNLVIAVDPQ